MEQLHPRDPHRIGPYRLLSRLGAGGTGQVYLARSDRGRTVAVKRVHRDLAAREEFRARLREEVDAARRVTGEWTTPLLDADTEAEVPWLATGYVAGPSLHQVVGRDFGPLPVRSVRILAAGLAHALQDIHRAGLVHGGLLPSNVLLTLDGPRVVDFGISRGSAGPGPDADRPGRPGRPVGPYGPSGFTAPEQTRGEPATAACDVFCLGAVLAYAVTGRPPLGGDEQPGGRAGFPLRRTEAEPDLADVPPELHALLRGCLRRDPAARPEPAEVLARVGAQDTVADGRALGPWLPGPLVARLGLHTVRLLDREEAGPDRAVPVPHAPPVPPAKIPVPPAPSEPSAPPLPPAPPAPLAPPAPPASTAAAASAGPWEADRVDRPRTASTVFLLAVAVVVAIAAGGTVYAVMNGPADPLAPGGGPGSTPRTAGSTATTSAPPGPATASGAPGTPGTPGPAPAGPGAGPGAGPAGTGVAALPGSYLGTWQATAGTQTWRLTLTPGAVGDPVMTLGVHDPGFACSWSAPLRSAPEPVELDASTVTSGPPQTCGPGSRSRLSLLPDGTLQRELADGTGAPLTYLRQ